MPNKIAHVLISMSVGGAEQLALKMMRANPELTVCLCLDKEGPLADEVRKINIPIFSLGREPGWDFKIAKKISDITHDCGIGLLHCHQYSPWFYAVLSRLFNPSPRIIYTEHGRPYPDKPKVARRLFNPVFSNLTDAITSVSPFISEALEKVEWFPRAKITTIFNGIEENFGHSNYSKTELQKKLKLSTGLTYIILPARFNPIKWHSGLVEAFRIVVEQFPHARLILLGDGQEKCNIDLLIAKYNLSKFVIMPGIQKNVHEWMAASDIFVLCSLSEGTSISLLEAMAIGLPSVVTDAGGNKYIIEDGKTALLAKHSDVFDLAQKLLFLCKNPQIRASFSSASKERFEKKFTLEKMLAKYKDLYSRLLGSRY